MDDLFKNKLISAVQRFSDWLERYGEVSQDQYDFWATTCGQYAKALYYRKPLLGSIAVAPIVFLDSFLPAARRCFRKRSRFPIADAHFAMGYFYIYQVTGDEKFYQKAIHFLEMLQQTRCPGYKHSGWGYPFDWMTNSGVIQAQTPLVTTTPYVYEAFVAASEIRPNPRWSEILHSIAEHLAFDFDDTLLNDQSSACSYIPRDKLTGKKYPPVVNASAYRAFVLTEAALRFKDKRYQNIAQKNLNFVLEAQQEDGSWFYAVGEKDQFVDHFHTCFVLKNLLKVAILTGDKRFQKAIIKGLEYYKTQLLDQIGLPKPFAKEQRFTTYRRELYDYAENINLYVLLQKTRSQFGEISDYPLQDLLSRWQKPDGSFRTRQLLLGWNNVPYHRWAQSQLFRSLTFLLVYGNAKTGN